MDEDLTEGLIDEGRPEDTLRNTAAQVLNW
jgi:hypothetical protein